MKKVISFKALLAFFLIVGFFFPTSTIAQQNESLQAKVEKLQQKVSQLETRVAKLEKLLLSNESDSKSSQAVNDSKPWENKQNWRKLERGMSKDEVSQILGEPDDIMTSGPSSYWRYANGGSVNFYDEDLDGWHEPR